VNVQNFSIRNVPDNVAAVLKTRAESNHRSLQGEIMAILEDAARNTSLESAAHGAGGLYDAGREFVHQELAAKTARKLTIEEIAKWVKSTGFKTPAESVQMIREDRDR
jgi:plasmid stability protein